MKAILISIKPEWVAKILNGEKTIEIRKTMPKCDLPIDVYIYCTKQNDLFKSYIRMGYYTTRSTADDLSYNGKGKVVAKFTLNKVGEVKQIQTDNWFIEIRKGIIDKVIASTPTILEKSCLTYEELNSYLKGKNGYAWHIDNLVIFDRPKELNEFKKRNGCMDFQGYVKYLYEPLTKAPQSWQFVESEK